MRIMFPGESAEYRTARDRLLEQEIGLRRAIEAVAAARRRLPPGGVVPEDYVFHGSGVDGVPTGVRLSELFARSEEHTSELQSQSNLVCRLLLEKKKKKEIHN